MMFVNVPCALLLEEHFGTIPLSFLRQQQIPYFLIRRQKKHVSNKYARSVSAVVLGTLAQKSEAPQADTVLRMKGHVKDRFLRVAPGKCDRKQQKRYGNWQQPVSRQAKPNKKNPGHLALKLQVGLAEALCTVSFKTRV